MAEGKKDTKKLCAVCGKEATRKCVQCYERFYCGPDHQAADWPKHKAHCAQHMEGFGNNQVDGRKWQKAQKEDKGKYPGFPAYYAG